MYIKKPKNNSKAFTLVELLVVVALIMVLSGISLRVLNVQGMRAKARDSERISDLKAIQNALELYFADHRTYPTSGWVDLATTGHALGVLVPNYITALPQEPTTQTTTDNDPCNNFQVPRYNYTSFDIAPADGFVDGYFLTSIMEVNTSNDAPNGTVDNNALGCENLYRWSDFGCTLSDDDKNVCYGVQNP